MSNSDSNESSTPTDGAAASTTSSSSAAVASRENFLRRLEQQQQRLDENDANNDDEADQPNTVVNESSTAVSTVDMKQKSSPHTLTAKEVVSSNGNSTVDNDLLVNYLTQCSSKGGTASTSTDVQSLIQDIDPSSLIFLKELATSSTPTSSATAINNDEEVSNNMTVTKQPSGETNATEKTPPRRVKKEKRRIRPKLLPTPNNDNDEQDLTHGELNDQEEEEGSTIRNELGFGDFATPKKKLLVAPSQPSTVDNAADSTNATATNTDNNSNNNGNVEQRLLELMEQNQTQMDQIQRRLDTLNTIMVQLVNDVGALRQQQQQQQHSSAGGNNLYGNIMGQVLSSPPLPPPPSDDGTTPPLPPQQQLELQQYSNQPPLPPQQPPPPNAQPQQQQQQQQQQPQPPRGILFPLLTTIYTTLTTTLPTQLRNLLQSTGPARLYIHIRREAIRRHAFQNVDWGSLVKMMVMVMIFSGKIGRNEQRPGGGAGRRNVRNENGDTFLGYVYELLENLVTWWRGHRIHTLILASFIAFLFQVGLMSFFYQVLWVERGVLWNVYLGRDVGGDDDDGEDTNDNGDDINNEGGVNAPNGGLAGVIAGANPALNVPQQAAAAPAPALIRRGPNNGGFVHDVLCLILSFVMSLIPAWKPHEWADPEEEEEEEDEQQQEQEEPNRPEVEDVTGDDLNDNDE